MPFFFFCFRWFLLLKCLTPTFLPILPSICAFTQSISKDTHFALTANSCCHFLKNNQFIQCINNVHNAKKATPATQSTGANKQQLRIARLLNIMLHFGLCSILPTGFFSPPFLWPTPEEQAPHLPTHIASLLLILNPQIYCRSRPPQTQRTTIRPH